MDSEARCEALARERRARISAENDAEEERLAAEVAARAEAAERERRTFELQMAQLQVAHQEAAASTAAYQSISSQHVAQTHLIDGVGAGITAGFQVGDILAITQAVHQPTVAPDPRAQARTMSVEEISERLDREISISPDQPRSSPPPSTPPPSGPQATSTPKT